jgi:putative ABC transport system permease protein
MQLAPIIAALKRSKTGAVLVVLQIALTLAIVSNVLSIIGARTALFTRPTGTDEPNLFAIGFRLTEGSGSQASLDTDLARVRAVPNVVDAVASNTYPLRGSGWVEGVSLRPGPNTVQQQSADTAVYALDWHGLGTLGLQLVAGRNFSAEETIQGQFNSGHMPGVAIVSQALGRQLFPQGNALGKVIFLTSDARKPITIVGVVERLQSPTAASTIDEHQSENSLIVPIASAGQGGLLLVRVRPGALAATMPKVRRALVDANPARLFGRLRPFQEVRSEAYAKDRSLAIALAVVCLILVLVTALGIVGLTSFWVARRKRQIGIRRALGASRTAIVRYFLLENAVLCSSGVLLGALAAQALNTWLWGRYAVARLPGAELLLCVALVLALGQAAALFPALRAARVAPSEALRSV